MTCLQVTQERSAYATNPPVGKEFFMRATCQQVNQENFAHATSPLIGREFAMQATS